MVSGATRDDREVAQVGLGTTWASLHPIDFLILSQTIDGHFLSASSDNIRLWNAADAGEEARGRMQFKIIPGHHGGMVSQMCELLKPISCIIRTTNYTLVVDPGARFLVSASGNRGWHGEATRTVFVHDIKAII